MERWQVQCEKMKHKIYERLKRCSEESNNTREGWKAEGDGVKEEEDGEERTEMVVLTPNGTVLTGMPVGPPLSLVRMFFWISQTHSCLFCYPLRVLPYRARRPQCKQEHIHTRPDTHTQTHLSKHGWVERAERVGRPRGRGGAQGFISGGMLLVSRDAHFICSQKNKWVLRPWSSWRTKYFPPPRFTLELYLRTLSQLPSILCTPLLHQSSPPFSCGITPKLSLTLTLSLLSAVPLCPHVTPICVSCMFCDSETIFSSRAWAIPE